jgi:alanyl-tRNA synthetase
MFEMLGNWSLDGYFKEEAIRLAYRYLIDVCGLDARRMYCTYFDDSNQAVIQPDNETRELWQKYFPDNPEKIIKGNFKDNFWMMGCSGPCGACTEIHYDIRKHDETNRSLDGSHDASHLVNTNHPEVIEIWNLVFMQFNALYDSMTGLTVYENLKQKFVDTGMGLERLAVVIGGHQTIYQLDIFQKIISYAHIMGRVPLYQDTYGNASVSDLGNIAYRIFADHIRTSCVAVFQGVEFDCTKRGFILRKIFRRLLMNYYIHLNQCVVQPITRHHAFKALITEVLNYFLFVDHDLQKLVNVLNSEEMTYIGKLNRLKNYYNQCIKKGKSTEWISESLLTDTMKQTYGVDPGLVDYLGRMTFVQV